MLQPDQFPAFVWERLSWFGLWIDGEETTPGHATTAGAITFTVLGAIATATFLNRKRLGPVRAWMKRHPWWTAGAGLITLPFGLYAVAIILMSLTKYLTFASALATTVGVLVALENNRRTHENTRLNQLREQKRQDRQAMAARTAFSHELTALCDYTAEIIRTLHTISEYPKDEQIATLRNTQFPSPPPTASSTIKEVVVSTENEDVAERCANIQRYLQLVRANLTLFKNPRADSDYHIESQILRAVILHSLCQSLFGYAREGDRAISEFNWDVVETYTLFLNIHSNTSYFEYVERVQARAPDPLDFNSPKIGPMPR